MFINIKYHSPFIYYISLISINTVIPYKRIYSTWLTMFRRFRKTLCNLELIFRNVTSSIFETNNIMSRYSPCFGSKITIDLINEIPPEDFLHVVNGNDTLLFMACVNTGVTKDILQRLIERGSDVTHISDYGDNFVHTLCHNKNLTLELLEYALNFGFKVTDTNNIGDTPLHIISQINSANFDKLFNYLLGKGANINARNINNETPLYCYCNHRAITKSLLEQYIKMGATLDSETFNAIISKSAVDESMLMYCLETNKELLGKHSPVLSYAAIRNPGIINNSFVDFLIENGLDINKEHSLFTPLQHLCNNLRSTKDQIRCLIRHGAEYHQISKHKLSAHSILSYHKGEEYANSI